MGSSESKQATCVTVKPEQAVKNGDLIDPRSPSVGITRTPIQVLGFSNRAEVKTKCPLAATDPRSPTVGITRTPARDVMRATVGTFARRLGILFQGESEGKIPPRTQRDGHKDVAVQELDSTEPLLPPQLSGAFDSPAEHATPVQDQFYTGGASSPFVLLEEPQVENEEDLSLEEAEEAKESPVHKRLSLSLITCHEGMTSQVVAMVHPECVSTQGVCEEDVESSHTTTVSEDNTPSADDASAQASPAEPEKAETSPEEADELQESSSAPPEPAVTPSPEPAQQPGRVRCLSLDSRSPSQVVFKPQWLARGFGTAGLRTRAVNGNSGRGGSSPLAVRVAVKTLSDENKGQPGKAKQKGSGGRSPLQILRQSNSPMDRPQVNPKVSTPDWQRQGQLERRVLSVTLDKENR